MIEIIKQKWDANKEHLGKFLSTQDLSSCSYLDLVKNTYSIVYNTGCLRDRDELDINHITEIDDGDYQGTLLYIMPFRTYQPCEYEYLMTYVGYGSCSGCDTLLDIQSRDYDSQIPTPRQLEMYMKLCLDIITNTIEPYNYGWRYDPDFDAIEIKQGENNE